MKSPGSPSLMFCHSEGGEAAEEPASPRHGQGPKPEQEPEGHDFSRALSKKSSPHSEPPPPIPPNSLPLKILPVTH